MKITRIKLEWIINGQPEKLKHSVLQNLGDAAKEALTATGNIGRPINDWQARDVNGVLLEMLRPIGEFGFQPGARLFLSLGVGIGGDTREPIRQHAAAVGLRFEVCNPTTGEWESF